MNPNEMTPIDDPGAVQELPAHEPKQTVQAQQADKIEGDNYWREQAIRARAEAADLMQYRGIIQALQDDSSLVDVLEKHLAGDIAEMSSNDDFDWMEEDETPKARVQQRAEPQVTRQDLQEAERRGALMEKERQELNSFLGTLATRGVPDHVTDEFLAFMRNPTGTTVEDLWAAYENRRSRTRAKSDEGEDQQLPPPPVATAPGGSERPEQKKFHEPSVDSGVYVFDANNPFA